MAGGLTRHEADPRFGSLGPALQVASKHFPSLWVVMKDVPEAVETANGGRREHNHPQTGCGALRGNGPYLPMTLRGMGMGTVSCLGLSVAVTELLFELDPVPSTPVAVGLPLGPFSR